MEKIKEQFEHIRFQEEDHRYFNGDEEYISVSSLISQYQIPFDREKQSKRLAKKRGIPQNEILSLWAFRRDYSTVRGSEFHLYVETYLNEKRKIDTITPIEREISEFHQFWDYKNKDKYQILGTEMIIADDEIKVAGTIDCLLLNTHDKSVYLVDWKTNREIRTKNFHQKFKSPYARLDDCEFNKYNIQTSIYRTILEKNLRIKIKDCYLIHFPPKENYKVIPCTYLKNETWQIFKERKSQVENS